MAQIATGRGSRVPSQLIRPRINELLVSTNTADSMRKTLPAAIVRSARAVLAQTDQTDEDHDARVRHMQEHELYGADFPYEAILSRRLWPRWASVAFARLLLASPLGR